MTIREICKIEISILSKIHWTDKKNLLSLEWKYSDHRTFFLSTFTYQEQKPEPVEENNKWC